MRTLERALDACPADPHRPVWLAQVAGLYRHIARRAAARLALSAKDYSHRFPNIVIQKN